MFNWTVGTKYRTRGGGWAKVVAVVPEAEQHTQLIIITSVGNVYGMYLTGRKYEDTSCNLDLLPEEWVEPKPKVKRYRYRLKSSCGEIWDSIRWYRTAQECVDDNTFRIVQILKQIDEDEFDE